MYIHPHTLPKYTANAICWETLVYANVNSNNESSYDFIYNSINNLVKVAKPFSDMYQITVCNFSSSN